MVSATAYPTINSGATSYRETRDQLSDFLIGATLIESYHSFARHNKPYPFSTPESLRPGNSTAVHEHPFQRSALLLVVDGPLPASLRKHIRCRSANEMTAANLARLAPEIAKDFVPLRGLSMEGEGFPALLNRLLDMDYALLMQRPHGDAPISLSHVHVKVERLTDNAVRVLARDLGYIRRTLYEKGEAHAEILERKFYEYFGFAANASGRKCAAAMAAQMLGEEAPRFAIYAACQEDCRLTVIAETGTVTHHLLIRLGAEALRRIGAQHTEHYLLDDSVVCYRVRFRRTAAAQPIKSAAAVRSETGLTEPWLEITATEVIPLPGCKAPARPYDWSG